MTMILFCENYSILQVTGGAKWLVQIKYFSFFLKYVCCKINTNDNDVFVFLFQCPQKIMYTIK